MCEREVVGRASGGGATALRRLWPGSSHANAETVLHDRLAMAICGGSLMFCIFSQTGHDNDQERCEASKEENGNSKYT